MKESNIILTIVARANKQQKNRPALILKELPKYGDLLVCGISTQLQHYTPDFDEIIREEDNDFVLSGLVKKSLIRLSFLSVIRQREVIGIIGSVSSDRHHRLLSNLSNYLKPTA
jgi:mRNA interferase MazF